MCQSKTHRCGIRFCAFFYYKVHLQRNARWYGEALRALVRQDIKVTRCQRWWLVIVERALALVLGPFVRLWRGQQSLPKAFWLYFVLGSYAATMLAVILAIPFVILEQPRAGLPLMVIVRVGYPIFAAIGVWRSAKNRPFRRWPVAAAAAKIGVVFFLTALAAQFTGITSIAALRSLLAT
jgi:hypothetical protein